MTLNMTRIANKYYFELMACFRIKLKYNDNNNNYNTIPDSQGPDPGIKNITQVLKGSVSRLHIQGPTPKVL